MALPVIGRFPRIGRQRQTGRRRAVAVDVHLLAHRNHIGFFLGPAHLDLVGAIAAGGQAEAGTAAGLPSAPLVGAVLPLVTGLQAPQLDGAVLRDPVLGVGTGVAGQGQGDLGGVVLAGSHQHRHAPHHGRHAQATDGRQGHRRGGGADFSGHGGAGTGTGRCTGGVGLCGTCLCGAGAGVRGHRARGLRPQHRLVRLRGWRVHRGPLGHGKGTVVLAHVVQAALGPHIGGGQRTAIVAQGVAAKRWIGCGACRGAELRIGCGLRRVLRLGVRHRLGRLVCLACQFRGQGAATARLDVQGIGSGPGGHEPPIRAHDPLGATGFIGPWRSHLGLPSRRLGRLARFGLGFGHRLAGCVMWGRAGLGRASLRRTHGTFLLRRTHPMGTRAGPICCKRNTKRGCSAGRRPIEWRPKRASFWTRGVAHASNGHGPAMRLDGDGAHDSSLSVGDEPGPISFGATQIIQL